jgi:hypothetical protein
MNRKIKANTVKRFHYDSVVRSKSICLRPHQITTSASNYALLDEHYLLKIYFDSTINYQLYFLLTLTT